MAGSSGMGLRSSGPHPFLHRGLLGSATASHLQPQDGQTGTIQPLAKRCGAPHRVEVVPHASGDIARDRVQPGLQHRCHQQAPAPQELPVQPQGCHIPGEPAVGRRRRSDQLLQPKHLPSSRQGCSYSKNKGRATVSPCRWARWNRV